MPAAVTIHKHAGHHHTAVSAENVSVPFSIFAPQDEETGKPVKRKWHREGGWRGVVALLLAIVAYVFLFVLWITWLPAILAIVTGMGSLIRRRRNRLLAALGLAGGAFVLYLWISTVLAAIL